MSFKRSSMDVGFTPPIEKKEVTAGETVVLGEALVLSGGKLTKCDATTKPDYIAVGPVVDDMAQVIKVYPYIIFDVTLSADGASLVQGSKVTISEDGLEVTATTASGVATIVAMEGTAVGDHVQVRFE